MNAQQEWELAVSRPDGTVSATLSLTVAGNVVTGTSSRSDGLTAAIVDGSFDGDVLTYDIEIHDPAPARLHFELTVSGDTLFGVFTSAQAGEGKVTGTRI
ncbi:hypothetical protein [Actinoplanes sp. ATCC 53533]|uniref:hypothetical protein n=1 Tax=Actinoplanes sp. ATCC 53533 TaxID=1288362 RepID=UPI000F7AB0BB|nr:hypothetical protein [Actinoplanes sp. ATCC 53533]